MNFYNPYYYSAASRATTSILSKINLKSIIAGTTKTLNFVNQTIPIFRQMTPVMRNAKTMFKLLNEFKKTDNTPVNEDNGENAELPEIVEEVTIKKESSNSPTFFA